MPETKTKTFDPRCLRFVIPGNLAVLTGIPVSNTEITADTARLFTPRNTDIGIAEIGVVAFVYNGNVGGALSGPIVRKVIDAYFEL